MPGKPLAQLADTHFVCFYIVAATVYVTVIIASTGFYLSALQCPCSASDYTTVRVFAYTFVCVFVYIYTHNYVCLTVLMSGSKWKLFGECVRVFVSASSPTDVKTNTHLFVVLSHVSWRISLMKPISF